MCLSEPSLESVNKFSKQLSWGNRVELRWPDVVITSFWIDQPKHLRHLVCPCVYGHLFLRRLEGRIPLARTKLAAHGCSQIAEGRGGDEGTF